MPVREDRLHQARRSDRVTAGQETAGWVHRELTLLR